MASLSTKIKLYLAANSVDSVDFTSDVLLQDDSNGQGPYIKEWNISGVAKPTNEQLAVHETAGNTEEANNVVKATRKAAYGDIGEQLDEIYKDIDAWKTRIKAVKDANPKS
jgi:hypothetical protein|tara:strand:+ start:204 stop:536 length:333 start_codon:yes stop_codon:yes gene_type:complete